MNVNYKKIMELWRIFSGIGFIYSLMVISAGTICSKINQMEFNKINLMIYIINVILTIPLILGFPIEIEYKINYYIYGFSQLIIDFINGYSIFYLLLSGSILYMSVRDKKKDYYLWFLATKPIADMIMIFVLMPTYKIITNSWNNYM